MRHLSFFLSFVLVPLLITAPMSAQDGLEIRMTNGAAGPVSINSEMPTGLTVDVTGPGGAPVADAAVALRLPDSEPTGVFPDGSHSAVGYTDQSGRASLQTVKWGSTPGTVTMRLTAVKGTAHVGILVEQTLTETPSAGKAPKVAQALVPAGSPGAPSGPGTPGAPASVQPETPSVKPALLPVAPPVKPEPSVSVTNSIAPVTKSHSHTKWIVIAAIAAGAGAGLAFAGKGKSGSSASPAPSLSIGAPSVSVGHP
ncbi:MAG TPA: hypothetical protein VH601_00460 [Bryobacteraceae bacterium]